jgi:hypothetical protein
VEKFWKRGMKGKKEERGKRKEIKRKGKDGKKEK